MQIAYFSCWQSFLSLSQLPPAQSSRGRVQSWSRETDKNISFTGGRLPDVKFNLGWLTTGTVNPGQVGGSSCEPAMSVSAPQCLTSVSASTPDKETHHLQEGSVDTNSRLNYCGGYGLT